MTTIDALLSGLRNNGYAHAADFIEALQAENERRQEIEKTLVARYQAVLGEQAILQEQLAVLERQNAQARAAVNALLSAMPFEQTPPRHAVHDPETILYSLRKLIADENYAASFPETALYREALLQFIPDPE